MNVFTPHRRTLRNRVEARRTRSQAFEMVSYTLLNGEVPKSPGVLAEHRARKRTYVREHARQYSALIPFALEFLVAAGVVVAFAFFIYTLGNNQRHATAKAEVAPEVTPTIPAVAPAVVSRGVVRILILGSDQRPSDGSFRTDVVVLLTVDPKEGRVSALSFPRDLIINIPKYGDNRINTVMALGGFNLLADAMEQNYGVRPQYYFKTNFDGFVGLINSIGGIDVDAEQSLTDACDLPQSREGQCTVDPGRVSMDGATALWYIRSRHTSSDFDRLRRAQEVMVGIFARFMDMKALARVPELYHQYRADVETNMKPAQILGLMPIAAQVAADRSRIQRFTIPQEMTADWITNEGARVLLPDANAVRALVQEASYMK